MTHKFYWSDFSKLNGWDINIIYLSEAVSQSLAWSLFWMIIRVNGEGGLDNCKN